MKESPMSPTRAPLPQLTDETEFFWKSGADGTLRIQECRGCASLIHPPQPVCRYCRSHDMGVRAVSGLAVLSAFTVNHRFSIPGLPAPYIVAQVAVREDPRVRLTTNIIDANPDDLQLGQLVEVVFEQNDDVYLPLFRPVTPTRLAEEPVDEPVFGVSSALRSPSSYPPMKTPPPVSSHLPGPEPDACPPD